MKKLSLQDWRARPKKAFPIYPSVYTMAYAVDPKCFRIYGAKLKTIMYVSGKDDIEIFIESKKDFREFGSLLVKKFKTNPAYLDKLVEWSEKNLNLLFDFINQKLNQDIIGRLSNKEIADRYSGYVKRYLAYHLKNTPAWWIGALAAEKELKNYLTHNYSGEDIDNLLVTITAPFEHLSANLAEELSLLNIAIKLNKSVNNLKKIKIISDLPKNIKHLLYQHFVIYTSLPFGYQTGVVWKEQDFFIRLLRFAKDKPDVLKVAKFKEIKIKKINRDKTMVGLNLPLNIKNIVIALRKLAYLQDLKKVTQTRSHPLLQFTVKEEIARRLNLAVQYLDYLNEDEIGSLLRTGSITPKLRKELVARESFSVLIIKNAKSYWLTGKRAKDFMKSNDIFSNINRGKEIKGQAASKGFIKGPVKICRVSTEINKIKKGDILVTAMTTPDFVPAMRRAAAIITDEGGITSHAAIVARELNKPCIIGTKIATKVLHDGDLVEVDANKGIIKILKKDSKKNK